MKYDYVMPRQQKKKSNTLWSGDWLPPLQYSPTIKALTTPHCDYEASIVSYHWSASKGTPYAPSVSSALMEPGAVLSR